MAKHAYVRSDCHNGMKYRSEMGRLITLSHIHCQIERIDYILGTLRTEYAVQEFYAIHSCIMIAIGLERLKARSMEMGVHGCLVKLNRANKNKLYE